MKVYLQWNAERAKREKGDAPCAVAGFLGILLEKQGETTVVNITICMGSSCFSRGNNQNLEAIRTWLCAHGKEAEIRLKGCRCGGMCGEGPNIWIEETCHSGVTPDAVPALLEAIFAEE